MISLEDVSIESLVTKEVTALERAMPARLKRLPRLRCKWEYLEILRWGDLKAQNAEVKLDEFPETLPLLV